MLNLGVLTSSLHGHVPSARVADLCLQYEEEKKKIFLFFIKKKANGKKKSVKNVEILCLCNLYMNLFGGAEKPRCLQGFIYL